MKLVMTLLVRDEADLVGEMLAHHRAAGVDHVVAMDNGSRDGTTEILRGFAEDGWLTLLHEPSEGYRQDTWVSEMARFAARGLGADWILCSDADEFWLPPAGASLKAAIAAAAADGADMLTVERRNMMGPEGTAPWPERLIYTPAAPGPLRWSDPMRDPLPDPYFYYAMPEKVILRGAGLLAVGRGAHAASYAGPAVTAPCEVTLYHVPLRDRAEFDRSVRHIGGAVRADGSLDPRVSGKYRRWLAMTERTGSIEAAWAEAMPDAARLRRDVAEGTLVEDLRLRDALRARGGTVPAPASSASASAGETAAADPTDPMAEIALLAGFLPRHTASLADLLRQKAGLPTLPAAGAWREADLALLQRQIAADPPEAPGSPAASDLRADLLGQALAQHRGAERMVIGAPFADTALPVWRALADEVTLDLRVALVIVDPVRAARELRAARGVPMELGVLAWLDQVLRLERESRGLRRVVLPLPPEGTALGPAAERLRRGLGLEWDAPMAPGSGAAWARSPATRFEVHAAPDLPAACKQALVVLDAAARADAPERLTPLFDRIAAEIGDLRPLLPALSHYRLGSFAVPETRETGLSG